MVLISRSNPRTVVAIVVVVSLAIPDVKAGILDLLGLGNLDQPHEKLCSPKEYHNPFWLTSEILDKEQMRILDSRRWLDNSIMNAYMNLMQSEYQDVFFMDVYFYVQLVGRMRERTEMSMITSEKDMLSKHPNVDELQKYRLILIPALLGHHWTLVTVEPAIKRITFFDSLHSRDAYPGNIIRSYFASLFGDEEEDWRVFEAEGIPRQRNGYDCGVFVLRYCASLASHEPFDFSQYDMRITRKVIKRRLFQC